MNIAIVLAAGNGTRFGGSIPKQFLDLDGRTVVEHSIDTFQQSPHIDEMAVVVHPDYIDHMRQIATQRQWSKLHDIIAGGSERYHSSLNAINNFVQRLAPSDCNKTNLIIHDAARPWILSEIIDRVALALKDHEAVAVGIPCTDTIWQTAENDEKYIHNIPPRSQMWRAQTPQAFRLSLLQKAYQKGLCDPRFAATDDCGVVLRYCPEVPILIVEGSENNRKITFADDL